MQGLFGKDKKLIEEYRMRCDTLSAQVKHLYLKNTALIDEIDVLYNVLVQKDASIFQLRKIIIENLNIQLSDNKGSLENELKEIFKTENYYDPTKIQSKEKQGVVNTNENNQQQNIDLMNEDGPVSNETTKEQYNGFELYDPSNQKEEKKDIENSEKNKLEVNESKEDVAEQNNEKELEVKFNIKADKPDINKKRTLARIKEDRRFLIKIKDPEVLARELYVFELELKEYSYPSFEALKQFVTRDNLLADEIHDEVDRLSEVLCKLKYFRSVFPKDTKEKITNELENYIFEILYPKLFAVDEDTRGFAIQLKDRLNVLKQLVTFEMLDVPVPLRKESIFNFAIKEFQKITVLKSPQLKLQAFQNCANHLIDVFLELVERNPDSDELFPLFIYTVLQANIDYLKIHADFIFTYLRKSLKLGQEGFLIVNLKAVIKFLSELDGTSLRDGKLEIKESGRYYDV